MGEKTAVSKCSIEEQIASIHVPYTAMISSKPTRCVVYFETVDFQFHSGLE
ncbi:hypothetical protein CEV34_0795 [Brucella pseudogrignonensis]|uniref:Uncharacterized protein n=1 Tax=Brucella pseudogrignonensis TaxID=419475 RepID=A0A256GRM4_9HYPH|nr:hypothetical protein CEV34_0795 [Brucella pseudogrignonensis]